MEIMTQQFCFKLIAAVSICFSTERLLNWRTGLQWERRLFFTQMAPRNDERYFLQKMLNKLNSLVVTESTFISERKAPLNREYLEYVHKLLPPIDLFWKILGWVLDGISLASERPLVENAYCFWRNIV